MNRELQVNGTIVSTELMISSERSTYSSISSSQSPGVTLKNVRINVTDGVDKLIYLCINVDDDIAVIHIYVCTTILCVTDDIKKNNMF